MAMRNRYLELSGRLEKSLCGLPVGSRIPKEDELARNFGVSRSTLRRALDELVKIGRVEKRAGVGNFVAAPTTEISKELIFVCSDFLSFPKAIQEFCAKATEAHYISSIVPLNGDATTQNRIIATAMARKPAGMAILPLPYFTDLPVFKELDKSGLPTVYLLRQPDGAEENLIENFSGYAITEIVRRLYREGRRKFAFYGDDSHVQLTNDIRKEGFLAGMKMCRLKPAPNSVCVKGAGPEERDAFFELFRSKERPEAVCAVSDYSLAHFLKEMRRRGIDADGLTLAGFDNAHVMNLFVEDFITGQPDQEAIGASMAETLIRQVENPDFAKRRIKVEPQIVDYRKSGSPLDRRPGK